MFPTPREYRRRTWTPDPLDCVIIFGVACVVAAMFGWAR